MNLGNTIKGGNTASLQDRAKALIFLRHHIDNGLKSDYNSALFKISSQLKLCGEKITDEDMLEKTYTTFHASNVLMQQQYRERRFTKYSELIACLLLAEQNNELLLKNHQSHPTGSIPLLEANATIQVNRRGRRRGHEYYEQGQGRGRGRYNSWNRGNYNQF